LVCTGNLNSNKDDDDDHGGISYENDYFATTNQNECTPKRSCSCQDRCVVFAQTAVKVQVLVRQKRKKPEQSPEDPTAGTAKTEINHKSPAWKRNGQQTEGGM
jgi:hypothetical protein